MPTSRGWCTSLARPSARRGPRHAVAAPATSAANALSRRNRRRVRGVASATVAGGAVSGESIIRCCGGDKSPCQEDIRTIPHLHDLDSQGHPLPVCGISPHGCPEWTSGGHDQGCYEGLKGRWCANSFPGLPIPAGREVYSAYHN